MDYKQLIINSGLRLLEENFTVETWGNLSVYDHEDELVYITPSNIDYRTIKAKNIAVLNLKGEQLDGDKRPSIETGLHLAIYAKRSDTRAIVHTHPIYSTVFSCIGKDIPLFMDEAIQVLGDVVHVADYALPGSNELSQRCVQALGDYSNAVLLKSHGAICLGADMSKAFKTAKVLEITAEILYRIHSIGAKPDLIPEDLYAIQLNNFRSEQNLDA